MSQTQQIIPTVRPCKIDSATASEPVDLVVVIDTSPSMKDEANDLSNAATAAIASASSSCPSDLRVIWLGIEGTWKGTNFHRTVRDYLLTECQVSKGDLRARKRGQLPDAGAQEDAARTVEDISTHFNWRPGAARAIFYLGDEALEAGGDRTEEKDIIAANKAIAKAQQAFVKVHTYFGTTKSKFKDSLEQEYARLAKETGGQAFSDRDSIGGFTEILQKIICNSRPVGIQLEIQQPLPCFELRSNRQPLAMQGSETIAIVASNCYSNVTFRSLTAVVSAVLKTDGTPILNLADGTPAVTIKPSIEIAFGDLLPIGSHNSEASGEILREIVIETNSPNSADYTLKIEYSYRAEFNFKGGDDFALEISS
ncbi:hypothetical protein WA1_19310 [Scytonema hofmannii PCC 7110]|uniref:VWFA domain-containing protein n=1 Tax=Scytonema hofmannii PCC 7110 TaxID=128403 RepID=A0A139XBV8_9CYAN|nr:hypothetical protein [Scytonema hofmannii]KYC42146.1 hypothetical protein WA1_19310 [Scytonema hofmannii PCC 7110]